MRFEIRQAKPDDLNSIVQVLREAASWLEGRGIPLWRDDEIAPEVIERDVRAGGFFVAECDGEVVGTFRFELSDPDVWPDVAHDDSAFIHRLAVRRRHAGGVLSGKILEWALQRTRDLGRRYLRLDCETQRTRLRRVYEEFGFRYHSDIETDMAPVARYEIDLSIEGRVR